MDLPRHAARIERVADSESGPEVPMGDARLGAVGCQVEDGRSGRFGTGSCGGRDGDQWEEGPGDGLALAEGCVYKVEKVGVWVRAAS